MIGMEFGIRTIKGKMRDKDEDSVLIITYNMIGGDSGEQSSVICAIADGMGGLNGGEIASNIAISVVREMHSCLIEARNEAAKDECLRDISRVANSRILNFSRENGPSEMGTTLDVCFLERGILYASNIGDSRIYLFKKNGEIIHTKDHSYVQELVDSGAIGESEVNSHPQRNILTRAVGLQSNVEADIYRWNVEKGDVILLCCDGLWSSLDRDRIKHFISRKKNAQEIVDELVKEANESDGSDNISAVLVKL
jgi:protein phosphatase